MAKARNNFVLHLHLIGAITSAVMATAVAVLLSQVCPAQPEQLWLLEPFVWGSAAIFVLGLAVEQILVQLLLKNVLKPTGKAAAVAIRVADGDISTPDWADRGNLDGLSSSMVGMVHRLQELVGTIRQYSHDAAAMAQEIAASTQQMTASTQEVASTTGDLTERANQQAVVVRAAAQDAGKILDIAQELAAGATQAAEETPHSRGWRGRTANSWTRAPTSWLGWRKRSSAVRRKPMRSPPRRRRSRSSSPRPRRSPSRRTC